MQFQTFTLLALLAALTARTATLETAQPLAADLIADMRGARILSVVPASAPEEPTALQLHLSFFDKDADGVVAREETVLSLRQLGLSTAKAHAAALAIHLFLGPRTTGSWSSLDVSVENIKLGKHGSDTGVYDAEGRFAPAAFERMFAEFDANHSGSLSGTEIADMIKANAKLRPGSETVSQQEFQLLLRIAADASEDSGGKHVPALSRLRMREFYDGSLFFKLAKPA